MVVIVNSSALFLVHCNQLKGQNSGVSFGACRLVCLFFIAIVRDFLVP